jgi:hypothetical protein
VEDRVELLTHPGMQAMAEELGLGAVDDAEGALGSGLVEEGAHRRHEEGAASERQRQGEERGRGQPAGGS